MASSDPPSPFGKKSPSTALKSFKEALQDLGSSSSLWVKEPTIFKGIQMVTSRGGGWIDIHDRDIRPSNTANPSDAGVSGSHGGAGSSSQEKRPYIGEVIQKSSFLDSAFKVQCGRRLKVLFYSHVILQAAVLLVTGAAVLSIKNFDNSFSNTHQRMGLGLYGLILVQPLIGFLRPHRGVKLRSIWYTAHWLLGTAISIIGIINIYLGLHAYEKKTSRSLRIWTILFTAQVVIIAFIYLLQDRWDYIKKQGVILGDEQISPSDVQMISTSPRHSNHKDLPSMI